MKTKRILIIDDDAELCEELQELLKEEGHRAAWASSIDPKEAAAKCGSYDIIILDYKMRGVTGIDILKKIKEGNVKSDIFIISGKPFVEKALQEENLSGLVSGIIVKPIDFDALLEKINSK